MCPVGYSSVCCRVCGVWYACYVVLIYGLGAHLCVRLICDVYIVVCMMYVIEVVCSTTIDYTCLLSSGSQHVQWTRGDPYGLGVHVAGSQYD